MFLPRVTPGEDGRRGGAGVRHRAGRRHTVPLCHLLFHREPDGIKFTCTKEKVIDNGNGKDHKVQYFW